MGAGQEVRYAYDGGERMLNGDGSNRSLVPFNVAQAHGEQNKRGKDALDFYSEMLDVRQKAIDVYDRIMDSYDKERYSVAVAALRERRGVVDTLVKMSLIAKRLGEEGDGPRRLSADLQSVVDALRATSSPVGDDEAHPIFDVAAEERDIVASAEVVEDRP